MRSDCGRHRRGKFGRWTILVGTALAIVSPAGVATAAPQGSAQLFTKFSISKDRPPYLKAVGICQGKKDPSAGALMEMSYSRKSGEPLIVQPVAESNGFSSHGTDPYAGWSDTNVFARDQGALPDGVEPDMITVRLICHFEGGDVVKEATPDIEKIGGGAKSNLVPKKTEPDPPSAPFTITSVSEKKCVVVGDENLGLADCQPDSKRQQWRYFHATVEGFGSNLIQSVATQRCVTFPPVGNDFALNTRPCGAGTARDWVDSVGTSGNVAIETNYTLESPAPDYSADPQGRVKVVSRHVCWYATADAVRAAGCGAGFDDRRDKPEFRWKRNPV
ncbi:hypothetical protein DFR70_110254 [Nocardia tenerifensis]|uniref:Uncharacterized protein n=1 Tax=Nocardia tenerifensis TaxID=228006 RepID=A0A318JZL0_9NOCA|nr:hypothetical protein DFR70_110254 [Nocardia tenerifensis]